MVEFCKYRDVCIYDKRTLRFKYIEFVPALTQLFLRLHFQEAISLIFGVLFGNEHSIIVQELVQEPIPYILVNLVMSDKGFFLWWYM